MPDRRPVTPEDLFQLQFVDAVALSPDGTRVVYQVRSIDPEKDCYESHLWLVAMRGGDPRRLTFGEHRNGCPAWSPDGKWIAFVSDRRDKKAQIYRMSLEGGEAQRLTDLDGRISAYSRLSRALLICASSPLIEACSWAACACVCSSVWRDL